MRILILLIVFTFTNVLWADIHYAARTCDIGTASQLLKSGVDVNKQNQSGRTPLHLAIWWGCIDMVEYLLLQEDIDIHIKEHSYGATPLHFSVSESQPEATKLLLEHDITGIDVKDYKGATPLFYASCFGELQSAKILIEKGANVNIVSNWYAPSFFANKLKMAKKSTALDMAYRYIDDKPMIKILLENGAKRYREL